MSDCWYIYTNKHGMMTNGMNKGSTCRRIDSPMEKWKMHAKRCAREWMIMQRCVHRRMNEKTCKMCSWTDEWMNMHLSRTEETVKPSNIQERRNVPKKHQVIQQTSKTLHTLPCRGEVVTHHEDIHHPATLQLDMHSNSSTNVPTLSCRVVSWDMSSRSPLWAMFSNQCNVMWKSKRPTCCIRSHVN